MVLTLDKSLPENYLAPPLPINSDDKTIQPKEAQSEFLGSRGSGGEGKTSYWNRTLESAYR